MKKNLTLEKGEKNNYVDFNIDDLQLEKITNSEAKLGVIFAKTDNLELNTRVLLLKINGKIESVVFNMNPNKTNDNNDFSGEVVIRNLKGKFLRGYLIENGIIKKVFKKTNNNLSNKNIDDSAECRLVCGDSADDKDCICNMQNLNEFEVVSSSPPKYISVMDIYSFESDGGNGYCEVDCDNNWFFGMGGATGNNSNNVDCGDDYVFDTVTNECVLFFDEDAMTGEAGVKPLKEFDDKCTGIDELWAMSEASGNEVAAVLTEDGAILIIAEGSRDGIDFPGLHNFMGKTYYGYEISKGKPARTYSGQVERVNRYFIPIKATIHSHTPCLTDGTDGLTNREIREDKIFAGEFKNINHFLIGCKSIGEFNHKTSNASNIQIGTLNIICEKIK